MKKLIICYSHSGNNLKLAQKMAAETHADLEIIKEVKKRTYLTIVLDQLFKRLPEIQPSIYDPSQYTDKIIVSPLWLGDIAAPLKSYLKQHKESFTNYSFVTLSGGANEHPQDRQGFITTMMQAIGNEPQHVMELHVKDLLPEANRSDLRKTMQFQIPTEQYQHYQEEIDAFLKKL